jgi:MFS superfamily sulfate permease-like transporter
MNPFTKVGMPVRKDVMSGFFVFLIALPLCIGISVASGFPVAAGIVTAIVGGIVVGMFHTAHVAIKGPAAGLIVVAISAVTELGGGDFERGYPLALAVILIAGVLQVLLGYLKSGFMTTFFPVTAVSGMLCAIGVIIVVRQIHPLFGQATPVGGNTEIIGAISHSFENMNLLAFLTGAGSLMILFLFPKLAFGFMKKVPAALWVLMLSIGVALMHRNGFFAGINLFGSDLSQAVLPTLNLPESIFADLRFPDFSDIFSPVSLKYIFMFTVVGSLETLLSAKAVDTLDPQSRTTDLNKDLMAVGAGNILAPLLGGLPMITEVVRSSANVQAGGRSSWSNVFHGLFLLVFIFTIPQLLSYIPVAALAAILIYTGYRLASPTLLGSIWKLQSDQIMVFIVTVVMTFTTDLLIGICCGALIEVLLQLFKGVSPKEVIRPEYAIGRSGRDTFVVKVRQAAVFSHIAVLNRILDRLPAGKRVIMDFTESEVVDYSFRQSIRGFADRYERTGGNVELRGIRID